MCDLLSISLGAMMDGDTMIKGDKLTGRSVKFCGFHGVKFVEGRCHGAGLLGKTRLSNTPCGAGQV